MKARILFIVLAATLPLPAQPLVTWSGESMRLQSASVTPQGQGWRLTVAMANDNGNSSLPSSYRRWWHFQVSNLNPAQATSIQVLVTNAGYTDIILPVMATSTDAGATYGAYSRLPTSSTPTYGGGTHTFTFTKPLGVTDLRLAKYFPYTVTMKNAWLAGLMTAPPGVLRSVTTIGSSIQGRTIEQVELTDGTVPDPGKRRVWIHAAVHPAETTAYFVVEGLVDFLLSGDPRAAVLLDQAILDIVPMPNPDGVHLGNYRTNAASANLEDEWAYPYNSTVPEILALRTAIEGFMGTSSSPGLNPIEVVLNLHSSHNVAYPFHFRHTANANFNLNTNPSGVVPSVKALETAWINAFRARSAFVNLGTTQSSSCGSPTRPFVECMMHDRWSIDPLWTGAPNNLGQVMAITFEGTYGYDASGSVWNTPDSYRQVGQELGLALADYLGILPSLTVTAFGTPSCGGPLITGGFTPITGGATLTLSGTQSPVTPFAYLVASTATTYLPLPPANCPLLVSPDVLLPVALGPTGSWSFSVNVPSGTNFTFDAQFVAAVLVAQTWSFYPSPGVIVQAIW